MAGDLAVGEKSPVSEHRRRGQRGLTVGPDVSDGLFENGIFLFLKSMNSVSFCYFCVDLNIAPKTMKICVTSLRCKLFRKNIKCYFSVYFECDKNCSFN